MAPDPHLFTTCLYMCGLEMEVDSRTAVLPSARGARGVAAITNGCRFDSKQKIAKKYCGMGRQNVRMILVHACGWYCG